MNQDLIFNKKIIWNGFLILLSIIIIIILVVLICQNSKISYFQNIISGYGFGQIPSNDTNLSPSVIIPNNLVTKSTDFKLLSLINQLKYNILQPKSNYKFTGTSQGIISTGNSENKQYANIVIIPGNADYILKQNNRQVYPSDILSIESGIYTSVYKNDDGHMNTINELLKTLNYKEGYKLNTLVYDFRKFEIDELRKQFKFYLKENTLILAYDFGCIISNLIINDLSTEDQSKISKLLYICPTIGGVALSVKDYFEQIKLNNHREYQSLLMSLPINDFYDRPITIYNSIGYRADDLKEIMNKLNIDSDKKSNEDFMKNIDKMNKLSKKAFIKPEKIQCIIICNNQYDTPVAYNYKNDLTAMPEAYLPENNNKNRASIPDKVLIGLQVPGDQVVPFSNIEKLQKFWNCQVEIIQNKNHFSILKSYELALIIVSLI